MTFSPPEVLRRINGFPIARLKNGSRFRWGYLLLLTAFFVGAMLSYWGYFEDEADNWVTGREMAQGQVLYRDLFSHHFPFPYIWSAGVIRLFGDSVLALRLSVWVFQLAGFGVAMALSGYDRSLGLAALFWSLLRRFYRGNLVLYNAFAATGLLVVFAITLSILTDDRKPGWKEAALFGLFAGVAILSDPLSVYAVGAAVLFLLARSPRMGFYAGLAAAAGPGLYVLVGLASGTFADFYQSAVLFNAEVYSRYVHTGANRFGDLFSTALSGLGITGSAWLAGDPQRPLALPYSLFDQWLFTGFLYRLGFLLFSVILLARKKYHAALFAYVTGAALLVIAPFDFRSQPFVVCALAAIFLVLTREGQQSKPPSGKMMTPINVLEIGAAVILGVLLAWLGWRVLADTYQNRQNMLPTVRFAPLIAETEKIERMACGQSDVYLAYYPIGNYQYWLTGFRPASKFLFLWPWVAETGLDRAIADIEGRERVIVVVVPGKVWGLYDVETYLRPLKEALDSRYVMVEENYYISPALHRRCLEER